MEGFTPVVLRQTGTPDSLAEVSPALLYGMHPCQWLGGQGSNVPEATLRQTRTAATMILLESSRNAAVWLYSPKNAISPKPTLANELWMACLLLP